MISSNQWGYWKSPPPQYVWRFPFKNSFCKLWYEKPQGNFHSITNCVVSAFALDGFFFFLRILKLEWSNLKRVEFCQTNDFSNNLLNLKRLCYLTLLKTIVSHFITNVWFFMFYREVLILRQRSLPSLLTLKPF